MPALPLTNTLLTDNDSNSSSFPQNIGLLSDMQIKDRIGDNWTNGEEDPRKDLVYST